MIQKVEDFRQACNSSAGVERGITGSLIIFIIFD